MSSDFRYAVRSLARNPLFTIAALGTLALGIGVNSTIFTLANAALFRPLPGISAPHQLAWISSVRPDDRRAQSMSFPDYIDVRDAAGDAFAGTLAFRPVPVSLGSGGEPQRVRGQLVTGSYFHVLGITAADGRVLNETDDQRGGRAAVAVVSYRLWQQQFGGSAAIVGQPITINGRSVEVVGVASRGFHGPALGETADIWMPLALQPQVFASEASLLDERGASWLRVIGRLRAGTDAGQAQLVIGAVARRLEEAYPETNRGRGLRVSSTGSALAPDGRAELVPLAGLLLAVTGLVLLIACANVANLLLARGAARALEIGIRAALGATRGRLVRQLLTESLTLALAGAAGGLLISFWAADLLLSFLPPSEFGDVRSTADARVVLYTAALAGASVCVFGLAPALAATRRASVPGLRAGGRAGGRTRLQGVFVVAQLSLSLVLLLGAGLSLRALQNAVAIDLGFNQERLLTASYDLVLQNYPRERRELFRRDLLARVEALPSIESATLTSVPPLSGTMVSTIVTGRSADGSPAESRAYLNAVASRYFETMEIGLLAGRGIGVGDRAGAPPVAVINETLARRMWGSAGEAVGRTIDIGDETLSVVGVARDSKYDEATEDARPFLYTALSQQAQLDRETLIVRTSGAPAAAAASVLAQIRSLDRAMPVFDVRTMETVLQERADKQRGISAMLLAFGLLALGLAALGLYGVMAYTVTLRTREMGLRLALGARPAQLTRLIAGDALRLAVTGAAIGLVLSVPLAYALGALVFGVRVADIGASAGACGLLLAVAVGAALVPGLRASRLDPMAALRVD